ncbi:hypothetical protein CBP36_19860 (plasmid) [Acidovorax carolinensis]|uniref:Uncharacterized protein n=1 Tax=Acidovorax carolinensis TaxID=553814 RepID=A0A240UI91_9BURK|nr:hypothetical protein [Acidovorax carolinensis]ART57166.1 hypothetical protein CBP35_19830 [Acidovorax carolinensis]ART61224.1 hypothetical protein CBP36_19860 [Acidovorax carolinensis]
MNQSASQIGCAFFLKRSDPSSGGWASMNGGESFRFNTLDSLKSRGGLWILSISQGDFAQSRECNHPSFRSADFLPTPITAIAEEICETNHKNYGPAVERASEIVSRVLTMANQMMPARNGVSVSSPTASLTNVIQRLSAPQLRNDPLPQELREAMPSLFKHAGGFKGGLQTDVLLRIPANRLKLAEAAFNMMVPASQWTETVIGKHPYPLRLAMGETRPVIVRATMRGSLLRGKISVPLAQHFTPANIRWFAMPEFAELAKIIDMTVDRIYVAEDSVPVSASLKIAPPAFSPAASSSVSAGLFAECFLHAVSSTSAYSARSNSNRPMQPYSIRAAWLSSFARSIMLREAFNLGNDGFTVVGYGSTHLFVSIQKRNIHQLLKSLSTSRYLSFPAGLVALAERRVELKATHEID